MFEVRFDFERMRFTHSIDIQARPEIVWAIWSDIERWSEWTASITGIESTLRAL